MNQAIASESTITAYAGLRPGMLAWPHRAFAAIGASRTPIAYKFVSPEYVDVFDIPIVRGRTFTAAERDGEHPVVIVSESIARELWPSGNGVGETFRLEQDFGSGTPPMDEPPMPARGVTVVGVSRDVAGFRFTDIKDAASSCRPASTRRRRGSRRAHQGDRRADGARRLLTKGDIVDSVADHAPTRLRAARRSRTRRMPRHNPARHARWGHDCRDRARHRSDRVCGEPARDHGGLPARRVDPRDTRRPPRSDADAQAGMIAFGRWCRKSGVDDRCSDSDRVPIPYWEKTRNEFAGITTAAEAESRFSPGPPASTRPAFPATMGFTQLSKTSLLKASRHGPADGNGIR